MWLSIHQRPRTTRRPSAGCTVVEPDDPSAAPDVPRVRAPLPPTAAEELRATALLAAQAHAGGPPVIGAAAAAAVLQRLTNPEDPRRFQAWLLQGLYHRIAVSEARRAQRTDALARAHEVRARSVLRLAATSPDPVVARRARIALVGLNAARHLAAS